MRPALKSLIFLPPELLQVWPMSLFFYNEQLFPHFIFGINLDFHLQQPGFLKMRLMTSSLIRFPELRVGTCPDS